MAVAYMVGYVLSYLYLRAVIRAKHDRHWLLIERLTVMALSLFSWLIVFALAFLFLISPLIKIDLDKQVKW